MLGVTLTDIAGSQHSFDPVDIDNEKDITKGKLFIKIRVGAHSYGFLSRHIIKIESYSTDESNDSEVAK